MALQSLLLLPLLSLLLLLSLLSLLLNFSHSFAKGQPATRCTFEATAGNQQCTPLEAG